MAPTLETSYNWLLDESGPKMIKEALALYGTSEHLGKSHNPIIMDWAKEVGAKVRLLYEADEIPWCGLFIAVVAKRAGKKVVKDPLWALNWGTFGKYTEAPKLGDVLVFVRKTKDGRKAGHVGLYIGEDDHTFHVLGGNQSNCVCIKPILKSRLYSARRPAYKVQPSNVRAIFLAKFGSLSTDES